jgi:hypothetical protein
MGSRKSSAAHQHEPASAPQSNAAPQRAQARRRAVDCVEGSLMYVFSTGAMAEESAIAPRGIRATAVYQAVRRWHVLALAVC